MKAAPFDYRRPDDLPGALALLAEHGGDARLLAGGQSLVPMMAMRLVRPALLVDVYRLPDLQGIVWEAGRVRMGACTRQCTLEHDASVRARLPLIHAALRWVGHDQTRNRGTVGGSLAHADPSAELPLAARVLGAQLQLRSHGGQTRQVDAADFFLGPMVTALQETECLTRIDWPAWEGPGIGAAFEETAIRHGDFAMASAACQLQIDAAGICRRVVLGAGGVGATPLAFGREAERLVGRRIDALQAREVAQDAARACEPGSDIHASAPYRTHLAAVLLERVVLQAAAAAGATRH